MFSSWIEESWGADVPGGGMDMYRDISNEVGLISRALDPVCP